MPARPVADRPRVAVRSVADAHRHRHRGADIDSESLDPGASAITWTCTGGANQDYTLKAQGAGYAIVNANSGLCLTTGSMTTPGSQITQQTCNASTAQTWQVNGIKAATALPSKWTAPINLPIIPVTAANLPDGTVLVWSADSPLNFTPGKTYTAVSNPTTQTSKQVIVTNTGHDMFCPGIVNLPDGRIYVMGGSSSDKTSIYTPSTSKWTSGDPMSYQRAFKNSVVLPNGQVVVVGGQTFALPFSDDTAVLTPEIWDPVKRTCRACITASRCCCRTDAC